MSGLVRYPVPLGEGRFCFVLLPNPLTHTDAARVIRYIQALILDAWNEAAAIAGDEMPYVPVDPKDE
jgi:hypothetical protein